MSPVGLRDHLTVPEPVPAERVTTLHGLELNAVRRSMWRRSGDGHARGVGLLNAGSGLDRLEAAARADRRASGVGLEGAAGSAIRSESRTALESPPAVTVIVSTWMPAARPVGFRDQRSFPLPVPLALNSWVQERRADADQAVLPLLSPLSETTAESGCPDVLPLATESRWFCGETPSTRGCETGGGEAVRRLPWPRATGRVPSQTGRRGPRPRDRGPAAGARAGRSG